MKRVIQSLRYALVSLVIFCSCGPSSNNRVSIPMSELARDASRLPLPLTLSGRVSDTNNSINTVVISPDSSNKATLLPSVTPDAGKPRLNPNHGEPWHRCDIPVGTPLDSKPKATAAVPVSNNPNVTIGQSSNPLPPSAAPLVNPKHGAPGHRCDIAVGAPLNTGQQSAAQQTINTTAPVQVELDNPASATPASSVVSSENMPSNPVPATVSDLSAIPKLKLQLPGTNTGTGPGNGRVKLNPKHGEPGHRCGVAVGAPLN